MKKNIVKKIALLLPLILGLAACKKDKVDDLLARPKDFTLVRELTTKEQYDVLLKMLNQRNAVSQLEFKEMEEQFIRESDITIIDKQEGKATIYEGNSYEMSTLREQIIQKSEGTQWPNVVTKTKNTMIIDDNRFYQANKEETNDIEDYNYSVYHDVDNLMGDYIADPVYMTLDPGTFLDFPMYLDNKGNYLSVGEVIVYNIEPIEGGFVHNVEEQFSFATLDKNGKLLNSYFSYSERVDLLVSEKRVDIEEIELSLRYRQGSKVTYGAKKEMPNKAQKLADFPRAIVFKDSRINLTTYNCSIGEGGTVNVQSPSINTQTVQVELRNKVNGDGVGEIFVGNFVLPKMKAVRFGLEYRLNKFPISGDEILISDFSVFDIRNSVDPLLQDVVKVVSFDHGDGEQYALVYLPEEGMPDEIAIVISTEFLVKVSPNQGAENPSAELEIVHLSFYENTLM